MSLPPMTPPAITARLRTASAASDLRPDRRLDAKLDMTEAGITARLRQVAALLALSQKLARCGQAPAVIPKTSLA
jgi:hypothetical protein